MKNGAFDEVGVYLKHDAWTALLAIEAVPASVHANERSCPRAQQLRVRKTA